MQVSWHMVLVTEPKPNWAVAESSGVQSCLCIWSQDPIWLVSYWSASLPPQTSLYSLRVHWFSYSPTRISKLPWRHFCLWKGAKLLLLIWTSDVLICHPADIAPKQALHLDWKKKTTVHKARDSQEIKEGRLWVVDFTFILLFSTSGGWWGSALSLVSFLDQLCLWICEVRLELAGVSWFSPEAILLLCSFHNLWPCGVSWW